MTKVSAANKEYMQCRLKKGFSCLVGQSDFDILRNILKGSFEDKLGCRLATKSKLHPAPPSLHY